MSLINKMLQDLEARERSEGAPKNLFDGVRPVSPSPLVRKSRFGIWLMLCALVVALGAGVFYVRERGDAPALVAAEPTAIKPAAQPVHRLEEQAQTGKAVALAPVVVEPAPPEEKPVASPPVAVPTAKPVPKPAAPAKPVVRSTPVSAPLADSSGTVEKRDYVPTPQERADVLYREATALAKGRVDEARAKLARALVIYPPHHPARELAAGLALQQGRTHEAQSLLEEGMRLAPRHLPFAMMLAWSQADAGADAAALATLESARGAGARDAAYLSFLAALYQRGGRHANAVGAYREALALNAQDARAWVGAGISLEAGGDAAGAIEAYRRALQIPGIASPLAQHAQQRLAALGK